MKVSTVPAGENFAGGRCILGFDLAVQIEDSAAWSKFNDLALVQLENPLAPFSTRNPRVTGPARGFPDLELARLLLR